MKFTAQLLRRSIRGASQATAREMQVADFP
jgi:hypothetical protein